MSKSTTLSSHCCQTRCTKLTISFPVVNTDVCQNRSFQCCQMPFIKLTRQPSPQCCQYWRTNVKICDAVFVDSSSFQCCQNLGRCLCIVRSGSWHFIFPMLPKSATLSLHRSQPKLTGHLSNVARNLRRCQTRCTARTVPTSRTIISYDDDVACFRWKQNIIAMRDKSRIEWGRYHFFFELARARWKRSIILSVN